MKLEEARVVGKIVGTADGGCADCVENLLVALERAFPEFFLRCETR